MSEKVKRERLLTPVGEAKWAHLAKPKPPFQGEKDRGSKYQLDVVFGLEDADWKRWATNIKALAKAAGNNVPIKPELDTDNKPTGRYFATFKTGEQFRPTVYDPTGRPYDPVPLIGNGSKVQVNFTPAEYKGLGGGVTLYLNAVQVKELVVYEAKSASSYGFTEAPPTPADDPDWERVPPALEADGGDELPF